MAQFYAWLGERKCSKIRLVVMDMWKPFRNVAREKAPRAAILFDKFHILRHLGEALDKVRKAEYVRVGGKDRRFIKGQKYTLLSRRENLTLEGERSLQLLLTANKRLPSVSTRSRTPKLSAAASSIGTTLNIIISESA
jgi:transposase